MIPFRQQWCAAVVSSVAFLAPVIPVAGQTNYQYEEIVAANRSDRQQGSLVQAQAPDGRFYGVAESAFPPPGPVGEAFRIDTTGLRESLGRLDLTFGLLLAADGAIYGVSNDQTNDGGVFFKIIGNVVVNLGRLDSISAFVGRLYRHSDGFFFGTVGEYIAGDYGAILRWDPSTGVATAVYQFTGNLLFDGFSPAGGLTLASDGWLYGSSFGFCPTGSCGVVYRFHPGTYALERVTAVPGNVPVGELTIGSDGRLYGNSTGDGINYGFIFAVDPVSRTSAAVHTFLGGNDGGCPANIGGGLVLASDGWFYGTTAGNQLSCPPGSTVFRVHPTGAFQTLHVFPGGWPFGGDSAGTGGLTLGRDGNLYGNTMRGTFYKLAAVNTPPGTSPTDPVTVTPTDSSTGQQPATITFTSGVTLPGSTSLSSVENPSIPPPFGFHVLGTYYEISTTATLTPPVSIRVCVTHPDVKGSTRLAHYENGTWNVNNTILPVQGTTVCGDFSSLSPFALIEPELSAFIQPPIDADGSSVFNPRGSVPVKFTATAAGGPTCELPAANIWVTRTAGGAVGIVNEGDYLMPSDNGSAFRVSDCQYVYNLNAWSLGPGTYRVEIRIGGVPRGFGTFGIR